MAYGRVDRTGTDRLRTKDRTDYQNRTGPDHTLKGGPGGPVVRRSPSDTATSGDCQTDETVSEFPLLLDRGILDHAHRD